MARTAARPAPAHAPSTFQTLLGTAGISADIAALTALDDRNDTDAALTGLLRQALERWGYGLHHLQHTAHWTGETIELREGGRAVTDLSAEPARIAAAYATLAAPDERDLSSWAALPEGHRTDIRAAAQLRVLIEDARDFETTWTADKHGLHYRVWRTENPADGEVLTVEYARPTSAAQLLADAAWDVITRIKDRALQRELMDRSAQGGMLQAFLGARHKNAAANLDALPEAHFTIQANVGRLTGADARNFEAYRTLQRATADTLTSLQDHAVKQVAATLGGDL
ncbi:DNA repair protein [Deinococcus soli (ex Cha et al. 2016)]|uniref:DNA repair protein n=2 Tax=Deinococcus soli (ex Cha et al. 2016) TaxID=1309411 RepID=A0AAE4BM78_9DEIO|nr:DNA repair protein [Deinococcus soli (ex Cha et al. 2016)]MDR6218795.1 hypothetical protein [Deinococcus soli (ex Cha et al. 2016)]MDR6328592.1 hypothetical protein [Deinococcus soli (ex Cha et al. 2016)]MDR6751921.1 hypothetical protein [Deinococcus soli (ex Cha et al. 2016)]